MQQFAAIWQNLTPRRRMIVAGATLFVFAAILALSLFSGRASQALLYAGLEGPQAAEVVSALEQRGAAYEIRGDSIYVDATRRDELRMMLAGEGVPAAGGEGYELLDSLSGFGTTSQMFDAAYWRAKEGELARTILASANVKAARVHIANPSAQPFRKDLHPTASVWLTTSEGSISVAQAKSLKFLVSSAVNGLSPEDVSVIDSEGGLVLTAEPDAATGGSGTRAADLKRNVERLLEARVGYGNAVVELSMETVTEQEAIHERRFDPDSRVAISTDVEERSDASDEAGAGAVTVASNLPQTDPAQGNSSKSNSSETRERTNYEVSETTREIVRQPGAVKRLTVAVLVDGIETADAEGNTSWAPRPEAELAALRTLVESAVGFDAARGDVVTLQSMIFEPVPELGTEAVAGAFGTTPLDLTSLIQSGVLALVALVLGLFVLRPLLIQRAGAAAALAAPEALPALTSDITPPLLGSDRAALPALEALDAGEFSMPMGMGSFGEEEAEDPVERLKKLIEDRKAESVELLRGWLEPSGERS